MVHVSHETPAQTDERLRRLLRETTITEYSDPHVFVERPRRQQTSMTRDALAAVVDDDVMSELVPGSVSEGEAFAVLKIHFPPGADNSGFVGWLASHIKQAVGTGVFVICGHNAARGGIYDYWGVPWDLRNRINDVIEALQRP